MKRTWKLWALLATGSALIAGCNSGDGVPSSMGAAPRTESSGVTQSPSATPPVSDSAGVTQSPSVAAGPDTPVSSDTRPAPSNPSATTAAPGTRPATPPPPAGSPEEAGVYVLKMGAKQGDSYKYRTQATMTMDLGKMSAMMGEKNNKPLQFTATTDVQRKFTKVNDKGFAVEETVLDVKASDDKGAGLAGMMGQGLKQAKGTKATTEYDSAGRIKPDPKQSGMPMGGDMASLSSMIGFQGMVMPNRPIKVGETWTESLDLQKMMNAMSPGRANFKMNAIPVKIKFDRVETAGSTKVGVFLVTIDAKPNMEANAEKTQMKMNFAMQSESTIKIDMATGLITQSDGTFRNTITMPNIGAPGTGTAPMKVSQIAKVSIRRI